jgi:hypothetical protein
MIRDAAALDLARRILESAAPDVVTDTLVQLTATLIQLAVETDEINATNEGLAKQLKVVQS